MQVTVEKDHLVIRLPLQPAVPSKSGRTLVVATSSGNQTTTAKIDGKPVIVGVTAYLKP